MTVFGPVIRKSDVENAIETTLRDWMLDHLGEAGRDTGRRAGGSLPELPMIRTWARRGEIATWAGDKLPAVIIHCRGLRDQPTPGSDQRYTAEWAAEVGVVAAASTERDTQEVSGIYAAEIRRILLQHGSLGGFALATDWIGEDYPLIADDKGRALGVGVVDLTVTTCNTVGRDDGPLEPHDPPSRDPHDDLAEVGAVTVEIEHL